MAYYDILSQLRTLLKTTAWQLALLLWIGSTFTSDTAKEPIPEDFSSVMDRNGPNRDVFRFGASGKQGLISSTFYTKLLLAHIRKAQKDTDDFT